MAAPSLGKLRGANGLADAGIDGLDSVRRAGDLDGFHGLQQAHEPVADRHQDIVDVPVLRVRDDGQPVLRALATVPGPDPASSITVAPGRPI